MSDYFKIEKETGRIKERGSNSEDALDFIKRNCCDTEVFILGDAPCWSTHFVDGKFVDRSETESEIDSYRSLRQKLLARTDRIVSLPDFPITSEQRDELLQYREWLRDFPTEYEADPEGFVWKDPPFNLEI